MTRAAYREAIAWCAQSGVELGLECDVHFSADDQLICLHDLTVDRTSTTVGRVSELTVAQLKRLDFGSRKYPGATAEQCELVTLAELLAMIVAARADGIPVSAVIESKHPNPRGADVENRVVAMLTELGWTGADAPVRLISFSRAAMQRYAELLPDVDRAFLIMTRFGRWQQGTLPPGVDTVGVDVRLLRKDPDFVARARGQGNLVNAWTVNEPADIQFCEDLGIVGFTTDYPDRVQEIAQFGPAERLLALTSADAEPHSGAFFSAPPIAYGVS
jgi:glycerophosphoryl diester phosphodiesterase